MAERGEDRRAYRIERGATLPVTNLANDIGAPSTAWQTLAGAVSGVLLTITPAARTTFRTFGVFQTNMTSAGTVTARAYTNPGAVLVGTWAMTWSAASASRSRMPTRRPTM